jgi:hypothetical protein
VEYLTRAAQATWGQGAAAAESWVQEQAHILKHDEHGAAKVLGALAHLPLEQAIDRVAALQARETALNYLTKRLSQIQYASFQAQGFPIGSGSVESANKLVVEARLKGSGMHWARSHVNAVVALRTIACSDRWTQAWPQIESHLRQHLRQKRRQRQRARRAALAATWTPPPMPAEAPSIPQPSGRRHSPSVVNGRPTALHPWKKRAFLAGRRPALTARPKS